MASLIRVAEQNRTSVSDYYINKMCDDIRLKMPEIHFSSVRIVQHNKFLHAAYQIRKAQHERMHGFCPTEDLYHATAENNVNSILKNNLDWRRVKRSRFGVGVSFSKSPEYANKFCNNQNGTQRVFIICEVLTGNALKVSSHNSPYPRQNIDTYRSESNMVVVKFEDDSFYPKCVIYYQTNSISPARSIHIRSPDSSHSIHNTSSRPVHSLRTTTPDSSRDHFRPRCTTTPATPDPYHSIRTTSTTYAGTRYSASNNNPEPSCRIF